MIEHRSLADLTTALWLRGERDVEVLRGEVDHAGYDVVLEVRRILRHIQLKARCRGGKRRAVGINVRLAQKPSGCVVWMEYDPETLELGPFLWLGGRPGEPLPPLSDKVGRHTKGNKDGEKLARPGQRIVKESAFVRLETVEALVERLFGPSRGSGRGRTESTVISSACAEPSSDREALALLRAHLRGRAAEKPLPPTAPDWLRRAQEGDFRFIPADLRFEDSSPLAHLIDGYVLVAQAGLGDPFAYADRAHEQARRAGDWSGSAVELWLSLFLEHRRERFQGGWPRGEDDLLDALCRELRARLTIGDEPVAAGGRL